MYVPPIPPEFLLLNYVLKTEAITGMAIGMKKLALGLNANANTSINVLKYVVISRVIHHF